MQGLPGSVLFACGQNAIRSPMAEGLMKYLHGLRLYVQSAGVRPGELDPFAVAVMDEIGIDISRHRPHSLGRRYPCLRGRRRARRSSRRWRPPS